MNLQTLDYFLRVAELGSINKAAADLQLSQPALSRHIAALEREMAAPLFRRTPAGVIPTDAGRLLADRVRPLLRQFAWVREQVGASAAGQVAIGVPPSWQAVFTAPLVERLLAEHPSVVPRVHEGVSHVLHDYMAAGVLDLCVVPTTAPDTTGYRRTPLVREPLCLVGPLPPGVRAGEPVPLAALDGLRLVLSGPANALRAIVQHALERRGLAFRLAVETDTLTLCLALAQRGLGHTVVPSSSLREAELDGLNRSGRPRGSDRAGGPGVPGERQGWAPIRGLSIAWALCENAARAHSPAVVHTRRLALDTVARALHGGGWMGAEATGASARAAQPSVI